MKLVAIYILRAAINEDIYGSDTDFVYDCYPVGRIKESISEKEKHQLKLIFKEVEYRQFLESQNDIETI